MPITNNIAWDEHLEAFKGSGVENYVRTAAAQGTSCPECREPFEPGAALSLIVELHQDPDADTGGRRYTARLYHRHCQAPDLIHRASLPTDVTG